MIDALSVHVARTRHRLLGLLTLPLALLTLSACVMETLPDQPVMIRSLYEASHCGLQSGELRLLRADADWAELEQRIGKLGTDTPSIPRAEAGELGVLVAWGEKPNAGSHLALNGEIATITKGTANLPVSFEDPDPDMAAAQVIVSPCLVLAVSGTAGLKRLKAGDLVADL
ncbi:MAG: protease complex subunit PrcB family protein [Pseudomonadota bacterium]